MIVNAQISDALDEVSDVVLIQLDFNDPISAFFPLAAITLASFLKANCFSTEIFDFNIQRLHYKRSHKEACLFVPKARLGIYGITVYFGMLAQALRVAKKIKKQYPGCMIIFGGPGLFEIERDVLKRFGLFVDMIVSREGVQTLVEAMNSVKNMGSLPANLPGTFVWQSGCIVEGPPRPLLENLNAWPIPDYGLIDFSIYLQHQEISEIPILAGTGCPFSCSFCSTCSFWGHQCRSKSPQRILYEMELLNRCYGTVSFSLIHDNLFSNNSFLQRFLMFFRAHNKKFTWSSSMRWDMINRQTINSLAEINCRGLTVGIETISDLGQKRIGKNLNLKQLENTIRLFEKHDIELHLGFVLDLPMSSREDNEMIVSQAFRLMSTFSNVDAKLTPVRFLNGSRIFKDRKQFSRTIPIILEKFLFLCTRHLPRTIWQLSNRTSISPLRIIEILH